MTREEHLDRLKKRWAAVVEKAATMPAKERIKWVDSLIPDFRADAKAAGFDLVFNYGIVLTVDDGDRVTTFFDENPNVRLTPQEFVEKFGLLSANAPEDDVQTKIERSAN